MTTSADQARASLGIRLRDIRRDAGRSGVELAQLAGWLSGRHDGRITRRQIVHGLISEYRRAA